ncbi:MAG: HAD-IIB family hydrolase [Acidobacteria bacterium]|nr:HAD-IIB family hydrolase [Acidobacteriota bacterium]
MVLILTDLDGTLLDQETYEWSPARPALERLRRKGIPWIPITSKTRAEVEVWRRRLGHSHPFIVENGGAAFIPEGYFPGGVAGARQRDGYEVLEWGEPYQQLVADLEIAAEECGCRVLGFQAMTPDVVASECGMQREDALLAKQREYDEPFVVLDEGKDEVLKAAIVRRGRKWTRGGRFWHILGENDKATAALALIALYRRQWHEVQTIGLGDGLNDVPFLLRVDHPVLIRSSRVQELQAAVPQGFVTTQPGPAGWNEAVLRFT